MTEREALCKARKLISKRIHWCQGSFARTHWGVNQYCAIGALRHVGGLEKAVDTLETSARMLFNMSVVGVNDNEGHRATLKMFDHAIELACQKEEVAP